jgi:hypothetical protein
MRARFYRWPLLQSTPSEERQAVLCPHADGRETSAGAEPASAGRRECGDAVADGHITRTGGGPNHRKVSRADVLWPATGNGECAVYDFQGHEPCGDGNESAKGSPKSEGRALPQRAQRNTEEEATTPSFTAKGAEVAKKGQRDLATVKPRSEGKDLPQRTQRNTEGDQNQEDPQDSSGELPAGASRDFTAKDAEVAEKEGQAGSATAMPKSEERALPQSTHRNTDEEATPSFTAKDANNEEPAGAGRDFTAENAEVGEVKVAEKEGHEQRTGLRIEDRLKGQNPEGIPGVESAKSIFFGVELGEGVADNRPVMPPSEPPRKSSQSEVLVVPKDVEHHAGR